MNGLTRFYTVRESLIIGIRQRKIRGGIGRGSGRSPNRTRHSNREPYPWCVNTDKWPNIVSRSAFQRLNLRFQKLDVVNGLIQHRRGVHLGPSRDQSLQDPYPLADPLPAVPRCHTLRVLRNLHVPPLRRLHRLRVYVYRLHRRHPEYHLPHRRHRVPLLTVRVYSCSCSCTLGWGLLKHYWGRVVVGGVGERECSGGCG